MGSDASVNLSELIDGRRMGWRQIKIVLWCCGVLLAEGYDLFGIGNVAPAIIKEFHISPAAFGGVFSISIIGLLLGNLSSGPLADRFGRRVVTAAGTFAFGLLTFALTFAFAGSLPHLLALRFLAGIGLGVAAPSALALSAEFAPQARRAFAIAVTIISMSVGGMLAGVVAGTLGARFGWRIVFDLGGLVPMAMAVAMLFLMPESVRLLSLRPGNDRRIALELQRVFPDLPFDPATHFVVSERTHPGFPVRHLFTEGRAGATTLLWAAFLLSQMSGIFLAMWLTSVIHGAGVPVAHAALVSSMLSIGGIVGGFIYIPVLARFGPVAMGFQFAFAALMIALIGRVGSSEGSLTLLIFLAGTGVIGGQCGNVALAGMFYPTAVRSTGVGWALGAGRCGAIIGPFIGGVLVARHLSLADLFLFAATPALGAACAYFLMARLPRLDRATEAVGIPSAAIVH